MNKINYLFYCLKENEIDKLEINFDGSGDDGNMEFASVEGKNEKKIKEVLNYYEISPNSFLDEPAPSFEKEQSGGFIRHPVTLSNVLWDVVYEVFKTSKINWCEGRGNKGSVVFDVLNERINLNYLKFSRCESFIEIKNPELVYDIE